MVVLRQRYMDNQNELIVENKTIKLNLLSFRSVPLFLTHVIIIFVSLTFVFLAILELIFKCNPITLVCGYSLHFTFYEVILLLPIISAVITGAILVKDLLTKSTFGNKKIRIIFLISVFILLISLILKDIA
jgi:hypothetical protein